MAKILYVIPHLAKAGTEKHLLILASGLSRKNFDITVCCLFEKGDMFEGYDLSIVKFICLNRKHVYDLRIIFDLIRLIRKEKYDIVHSYLFGFHYLATIPAKTTGVRMVISSRRELATWKKRHHRFLENLGNLFTDKVITCSEAARDFSLKNENLSEDKITTIYNGINLNKFYPIEKNKEILNDFGLTAQDKIIGMVANFSAVKDHQALLKAVNEIKKRYSSIKCILAGGGSLRVSIAAEVDHLGLKNNVIFTGRRDDVERILSVMDVFVLSSLSEGMPNAALEAMACGLPVVATNVGGIPEVVEDGKSGMLVEPKDSMAIANTIIKLLEDEALRRNMGEYGREVVKRKFSLERMVKDYEVFYKNAVKENVN